MNILSRWRWKAQPPFCDRCRSFKQSLSSQSDAHKLLLSFAFEDLRSLCPFCVQLYNLLSDDRDKNPTIATLPGDRYELWRNKVALAAEGLQYQQAFYFNLRLLSSRRELWMVPYAITPRQYVVPDDIDLIKKAKSWIDECCLHHRSTCDSTLREASMTLNVIDCTTRQLRILPEHSRYVCLSYVWGISSSQNVDQVDLHDLPRTMEDAIRVTTLLRLRYLWVDRYCINQANHAQKHYLISHMDIIYQGAAVTIIAAAGDGPHAGLPGIGDTPRAEQYEIAIAGEQHMVFANPKVEISQASWSSRGWTYQEMLLSRRRLVFTPSQIYFQCNSMHCSELITTRFSKATGSTGPAKAFPQLQSAYADGYIFDCLREYYKRRLSYQTDIITAFMGIIGSFTLDRRGRTLRASQLYGVPLLYLDADEPGKHYPTPNEPAMPTITFLTGLAWSISGTELWPKQANNNKLFPSWAWASVKSNRGGGDCGSLSFPARPHQGPVDYGQSTRVYIHHLSEGRIELCGHTDQWSNYEIYHPWIDVESWTTTSVLVPEPGVGTQSGPMGYRLSGFEGGTLIFDYGHQNQTAGVVTVVLLGGYHSYSDPGVAIFLMLEEADAGLYRRIGIYRSVEHERNYTMSRLARLITPQSVVRRKPIRPVDAQDARQTFPGHSVEGELTWQRGTVRLV